MSAIKKTMLGGMLTLAIAFPAAALDVNDVKAMLQGGVQEQTIITMLQSRSLAYQPSAQDVADLSAMGASPTLLSYVTAGGTTTASCPPQAPTYIVQQPEIVVAPPPVVRYYTVPHRRVFSRPGFSFHFGGGRRWGHGHRRPRFPFGGRPFRPYR